MSKSICLTIEKTEEEELAEHDIDFERDNLIEESMIKRYEREGK